MPRRGEPALVPRGARDSYALTPPRRVEHFFRHEYGKLVATLLRRVGVRHVEAVEDAVQSALTKALEAWTLAGLPEEPSAWLFRVARNELAGDLRKREGRRRILERAALPALDFPALREPDVLLAGEVRDDLLRLLFVCCDEAIPRESQLVLALKTLCGFSVGEIARRTFASEAHVYKRLSRARSRLRTLPTSLQPPTLEQYASRLPAVHQILYLLFTEGYLSSHPEAAVRRELCEEALRLTSVLVEHPLGRVPNTCALLSLMHLHVARSGARQDAAGGLLLLEEQDRSLFDRRHIGLGLHWLAQSAAGDAFSRYHAEAGIAAEHCLAPSFEATRWDRVIDCYALLERVSPSPVHRLNRAVATAHGRGAAAGLAVLDGFEPPTWLSGSYLWSAVLADLHRRGGHAEQAQRYRAAAMQSAPSAATRHLLQRRLG